MTQLHDELNTIARRAIEALDTDPVASKLVGGTMCRDEYDYYLAQVQHQIRGTSAMLAAAATRLAELDRPVLSTLFRQKSKQEDHDAWPAQDRAAVTMPGHDVAPVPASNAVVAYRAFTWFLATTDPAAVLGVAHLLEMLGRERAARAAQNLVKHSGIPGIERALRFLEGHGEADEHHVEALEEALDQVRDAAEAEKVLLAARLTAWFYLAFFRPEAGAA